MTKSPFPKPVGMILWGICGLAALNYGLAAHGHDLLSFLPAGAQEGAVWVFALAGLASLVSLVWSLVAPDSCKSC